MYTAVRHASPGVFLERAEGWLLAREDRHNLVLSLAYARVGTVPDKGGAYFATVERGNEVVGCVMRTPPHKALVTDLPTEAGEVVAASLAEVYDGLPAVLGPAGASESVATAWVGLKGGGLRPGMEMGVYRLDSVTPPAEVPGVLRDATSEDVELAVAWGEGFARDAGAQFATRRESIAHWIEGRALHIWEVAGEPVSITVAQGRTPNGIRVGYVYTPPEHRRHGYASACVAAVSQKMLDSGLTFCVLYTDLSNPTSNAIYQRLGYELIEGVRDYDVLADAVP